MDGLARDLSRNEDTGTQLTALGIDSNPAIQKNSATFIKNDDLLGPLSIVAGGAASPGGTLVLSTTAYISGTQTKIDVYRLPV